MIAQEDDIDDNENEQLSIVLDGQHFFDYRLFIFTYQAGSRAVQTGLLDFLADWFDDHVGHNMDRAEGVHEASRQDIRRLRQ